MAAPGEVPEERRAAPRSGEIGMGGEGRRDGGLIRAKEVYVVTLTHNAYYRPLSSSFSGEEVKPSQGPQYHVIRPCQATNLRDPGNLISAVNRSSPRSLSVCPRDRVRLGKIFIRIALSFVLSPVICFSSAFPSTSRAHLRYTIQRFNLMVFSRR